MNVLACDKPVQNFVVTSADMVSKSGVWAHWGLWDFTKKYVLDNKGTKSNAQIADDIGANITLVNKYVNDLNQISRDARNKNIKETDLINQWLAPYPSFIPVENGYVVDCVRDNTSIKCDNTVVINITTQKVTSSLNPNLQIARVLTISNNELLIAPVNPNGNVDVVILQDGGSYRSYLAYSPLGASLFGRLFFLDGAGLPMFKKVSDLNSITQGRIIVWETQWDQTSFELDK
jgi:hypothetical protein